MSDHIIRKWRRDCCQEMSAGGMRVGMPHISVLCTDALRTCLGIEHLSAELAERERDLVAEVKASNAMLGELEAVRTELAERDAEIERLRGETDNWLKLARDEIKAPRQELLAEHNRARLPEELSKRLRRWDGTIWLNDPVVRDLLRDILAWHEQGDGK